MSSISTVLWILDVVVLLLVDGTEEVMPVGKQKSLNKKKKVIWKGGLLYLCYVLLMSCASMLTSCNYRLQCTITI